MWNHPDRRARHVTNPTNRFRGEIQNAATIESPERAEQKQVERIARKNNKNPFTTRRCKRRKRGEASDVKG